MENLKLSTNTAKLHQMFGKKLYSSKYSFMSEVCQNAVDSHRMAGVKEPIEVGTDFESRDPRFLQGRFYVQDYGLSFENKEDFISKVCTILESGKSSEKTNSEDCAMGEHGIGSISVSAFNTEWYYTIVKNGRLFRATIKETEGVGLGFKLSDYEETTQRDGVLFEVEIPASEHFTHFISQMRLKLAYFKDVMFKFCNTSIARDKRLLILNAEFKLFQSDDFQVSTLSPYGEMHISLDQYSYQIRWSELGISTIPLNIALKFGMADGLSSDITRENLIFNKEYKSIILKKIEKVATWFIEKYNSTVPEEFTSIKDLIKARAETRHVQINGHRYPIDDLIRYSTTKVRLLKFKGVSDKTLEIFIKEVVNNQDLAFKWVGWITNSGVYSKKGSWRRHTNAKSILIDDDCPKMTMKYIKHEMKGSHFYRSIQHKLGSFIKLLGLPSRKAAKILFLKTGEHCYRPIINEVKSLIDVYKKEYFTDVNDIVVPKSFKDSLKVTGPTKEKVDLVNMKGDIGIKYAVSTYYGNFNCKFVEKITPIKDLASIPELVVYGEDKDRALLDKLFVLTRYGAGNFKIKIATINKTSSAVIEKLKLNNFMKIEEYFKGKHDSFRKVMTSYMINQLMHTYSEVFRHKDIIKDHLCPNLGRDLEELTKHNAKYACQWIGAMDKKFIQSLTDIMDEGKLYYEPIWTKYCNIKEEISRYDFLHLITTINHYDKARKLEAIKLAQDIAIARRDRFEWKHYKPVV